MSILSKIRDNVGLVIVVIALSLAIFILTDFLKPRGGNRGSGGDNQVGTAFGEPIGYDALSEASARVERMYKLQLLEQGKEYDPDDIDLGYNLREQAWNEIKTRALLEHQAGQLGMTIGDAEVKSMFFGPAFHPMVFQSRYFRDSTNRFDTTLVGRMMALADETTFDNPQTGWIKHYMNDLTEQLVFQRLQEKYFRLIMATGSLVSDNEVNTMLRDEAKTVKFSFVFAPYAAIPDANITPSEEDLKNYYNKHKEAYRRSEPAVKLKYAVFRVVPSRSDSAELRTQVAELKKDLLSSTTGQDAALAMSTTNLDTNFRLLADLPEEAKALALAGRTDTVSGPFPRKNGVTLYQFVGSMTDSQNVYHLRHIYLAPGPDSAATEARAKTLAAHLTKENFADSARVHSADKQSSQKGGDLGWMRLGRIGEKFDNAVKATPAGGITAVEIEDGWHIIYVEDVTNKFYKVLAPTLDYVISSETTDSLYKRAAGFQAKIREGATWEDANKAFPDAVVLVSPDLTQSSYQLNNVPGARPVILWGFKHPVGTLCEDVLEGKNTLVVAQVEKSDTKGYRSYESVKEDLKPLVVADLKAKQLKESMKKANSQDFSQVAATMGNGARAGVAENASFSGGVAMGLGYEPYIIGRAFGLKPGEVSPPLKGLAGIYMIKVEAFTEAPAPTPEQIAQRKLMLAEQKRSKVLNAAFNALAEVGDFEDMRYKFDF